MLRLYTFMVSHFAEKARWTLDHKRVRYEERRLLPGPHVATTRRLGSTSSVPLLMHDGRVIQGSKEIIDYADERWPERSLTPDDGAERDRALELEKWLDAELGQTLRRFFYFHALERRELTVYMFTHGGPWWGRLFYGIGYPQVAAAIRKMYAIDADTAAADRARAVRAFARLDEQLRGNRYLIGDRFSRADLTLAALSAPLFRPAEHCTRWPPDVLYPSEILAMREQLERCRTAEHVLQMYREHRQ